MKNLGNLSPASGSRTKRKRLGRGIGSGLGKTAGKGHKGQKARKSGSPGVAYEGGQTPLYRRIPKRGFTGPQREFSVVSMRDILRICANDANVTALDKEYLYKHRVIKSLKFPLKIIGNQPLDRKLNVVADQFTSGAKGAIEKSGGTTKED